MSRTAIYSQSTPAGDGSTEPFLIRRTLELRRPDLTTRGDSSPDVLDQLADAMNVEGDFVAEDRSDPNDRNGGIADIRLRNADAWTTYPAALRPGSRLGRTSR